MECMTMKQKKVFLLSGIPGSGKSTWVRNHLTSTSVWISRDRVRFDIVSEDEEYFSHEEEVFDTFIAYINKMLNDPRVDTIYIDATHVNRKSRNKTLNRIFKDKVTELNSVCFTAPLGICQERNLRRSGREIIPETVINRMFESFSIPNKNEGFNHVYTVNEKGEMKEAICE